MVRMVGMAICTVMKNGFDFPFVITVFYMAILTIPIISGPTISGLSGSLAYGGIGPWGGRAVSIWEVTK